MFHTKLFLKHKEQLLGGIGIRCSLILWLRKGLRVRCPCRLILKGVTPAIHKQVSCALKEKAAVKVQLLQEWHTRLTIKSEFKWTASIKSREKRDPGQANFKEEARLIKNKKTPGNASKEAVDFLERFIFMLQLHFLTAPVKWNQHLSVTKWKNSFLSCKPGILWWQGVPRHLTEFHRTIVDGLSIWSASRGWVFTLA